MNRSQETKRRLYDVLIERAFRSEVKHSDERVGRADFEALEKEISIDIADLRRDIRNLRRDLKLPVKRSVTHRDGYAYRKMNETLKIPNVPEADQDSDKDSSRGHLAKYHIDEGKSFKVDNSPEVVQHLVQTLGLIGVSSPSMERVNTRQDPSRPVSMAFFE